MALKEELLELVRTDPEVRAAVRRDILTEDLLAVPARLDVLTAAQQRTEEQIAALAAAQLRTEERLEALVAAQLRTEERLEALIQVVDAIAREVHGLSDWRRGEQGRREGERYERDTIRHADSIFGGGRGATEQPEDLDRIRRALAPLFASPAGLAEAANPLLADILWLKGERIAVVEVSRQVDRSDVDRADRRAESLRSAGLPALAVAIGRDWASEEAERAAHERNIEWRVAEDASAGYLEFRRAPAA